MGSTQTHSRNSHAEFVEKPWARAAFFTVWLTHYPIMKMWVRSVQGAEHVPPHGPAIIASNHASYMDFFCIEFALPRRIHFLAAEKFFQSPLWRPLMVATNQIRCDRSHTQQSRVYNTVISALRQGRLIGIFPEGTRSHNGKLRPSKHGVARFALASGAPVIPVGLVGTHEILPPHRKFPSLKKKCTVNIGPPLTFNDLQSRRDDPEALKTVTNRIMQEIARLSGQKYQFE